MRVHIALVGKREEPILLGIRQYGAIDKVYLLYSGGKDGTAEVAKTIKQWLEPSGIRNVTLREIDPFSMHSIVQAITSIARIEHSSELYINITGGTNLMAGAATAASFFIGAQAYYIKDPTKLPANSPMKDSLIELPVPKIPYYKTLEENQIDLLKTISKADGKIHSRMIMDQLNLSAQTVSYNIKELIRKNLVVSRIDGNDSRKKYLCLTDAGQLLCSWITKGQK